MVFMQFLASEEFAEIFDEVRNLMSGSGGMSYGEIALAAFREYRDRHSPAARQKRREAKKKGPASPDSHQWESNAGETSRNLPGMVRKRQTGLHSHQWECREVSTRAKRSYRSAGEW